MEKLLEAAEWQDLKDHSLAFTGAVGLMVLPPCARALADPLRLDLHVPPRPAQPSSTQCGRGVTAGVRRVSVQLPILTEHHDGVLPLVPSCSSNEFKLS